ncbi:S8 family serine peptidase [Streptomyces bambusae]|nr:S8 family serine peptidase [Streptomyces bambusae]
MRKELKRASAAGVAAAAAVALLAGLTTPSAAQTVHTADPLPAAADTGTARKGLTRITLVTGDRVVVDGQGRPVGLERAPGRARIPVSVERDGTHTRVVPYDARRLIADGTLDARLFDVTELSRPEYRASHGDRLRLIIGYQGAAPAARAALRNAGDTDVRHTFRTLGAEAVSAGPQGAAAVWEALTDRQRATGSRTAAAGIARIWLDGIRKAGLDKSTRQIGADKAWAAGYDGKGVKIAVLDTGVDATHPDLAGQVLAAKNFTRSADTKDRVGHGTHVASIAAGTGAASGGRLKGVAPGAKVLAGKVLDDGGSGDDSGILAGFEWAVAEGADIINLSLGGGDTPQLDPLEAAVNKLSADKGVLFAVAAGNSGPGAGTVDSPGSAEAALTVGAVDDKDVLAPFSSTGPRTGDGGLKPDVTAPGVDITAAAAPGSLIEREVGQNPPGYLSISGTSMATPHAAGAAALLKQQHPQWKADRLKGVLTASTKGGAYTAFQQGSGRIAVDRALGQQVIAEPVSLGFGVRQWPHQDDKPVTKNLTYRNLGSAPVTLTLAVRATGPDNKPAPKGFFTLGARQVTVPAGGTASVPVTADTRPGGTKDGAYSAYVTATGGGQSVRTAAAVDREVESYDVTVKHIGRDGKPAKYADTTLIGVSGPAADRRYGIYDPSGTGTLRVPRGGYLMNSAAIDDPEAAQPGIDWIARPRLDISRNTTLTVDARTAKPVDITVPAADAVSAFAAPGYTVTTSGGWMSFGWWLDSYRNFRMTQQGPDVPAGSLSQQFDGHWMRGAADEYHVVLGGPVRRLADGYTKHLKAAELATVKVAQGVAATGKQGVLTSLGWLPQAAGATSASVPRPLPGTTTLHLSAQDGVKWDTYFDQSGGKDAEGFPLVEASYQTIAPRVYQSGKTYRETFNTAVFGPLVGGGFGINRVRDEIVASLPLFADGAGHLGGSEVTKADTVLYRNGVPVGRNNDPLTGGSFKVPAGDAAYKLTTTVDRSPALSMVSTRIKAAWWFRSAKTTKETPLPVSVVRFAPEVALDGTSPAGRTVAIPLTVQGPAGGKGLKSLAVYASTDGGYTWKKLTVKDGRVSVKNPAKGKAVSLRAVVEDRNGNKGDVTIVNAYCAG